MIVAQAFTRWHDGYILDQSLIKMCPVAGCGFIGFPLMRGAAAIVNRNQEEQVMSKLNGKVALITGASRGISQAVAPRLAAEGVLFNQVAFPAFDQACLCRKSTRIKIACCTYTRVVPHSLSFA